MASGRLSPLDRLTGLAFLLLWKGLGLVALPLLLLHPEGRRRILGLLCPEPGWTWIHGASAGEQVVVRALLPFLPRRSWRTASSWRTPVPGTFPAPLDLPFVASRWIDRARPGRLILVEAELWPGWLHHCRRRGIPVVVVNAREGRGTRRWRSIGPLFRWLTEGVSFIRQDEVGDLKLCAPLPEPAFLLGRPAIVGASTRPDDEARLLGAWRLLPPPRPMLILAPRHLSRAAEVWSLLCQEEGVRVGRRSTSTTFDEDLLLLDTLGDLAGLLPQARVAFIGGTFDPTIGGHSPSEALQAGLPVVRGPFTSANPVAWGAGKVFPVEEDTAEALAAALLAAMRTFHSSPVPPPALSQADSAALVAERLPAPILPPETPQRPLLAPLVPLVRILGSRRRAFRGPAEHAPIPVVSVGALVAGGAGKTPVVGWLAAKLAGSWVIARGYRRDRAGPNLRIGLPGEPPAFDLGDELEMLRRRGIPVISCPDRLEAAREAARLGARLVLLDDGFQHRRLHRDIDIACIDARWPRGRGLIPVGMGREPWSALERAHALWIHHPGVPPPLPQRMVVRSRPIPTGWRTPEGLLPLDAIQGRVRIQVGIARPEGFLSTLIELGLEIEAARVLPDHAPIRSIHPGDVLTEKDAARLPADAPVRALLVDLEVEGAEPLLDAIRRLEP